MRLYEKKKSEITCICEITIEFYNKKCKNKIIIVVKIAITMFEYKSVCLCFGATQTKKNTPLNLTALILNKVNVSLCTCDYKTYIPFKFWCRILQCFNTQVKSVYRYNV